MGNCSLRGQALPIPNHDASKNFDFIRVIMMHSGDILKLDSPKSVGEILNDFPGHMIFGQDHMSLPLSDQEYLVPGKSYYLHPPSNSKIEVGSRSYLNEKEPVRISSAAMEIVSSLANGSGLQVLAPKQKGVWRVKLAISPRQLEEILAQEVNTEALIEQMRMAAFSSCLTPRKNRVSWGLICKPVLANALKFSTQS